MTNYSAPHLKNCLFLAFEPFKKRADINMKDFIKLRIEVLLYSSDCLETVLNGTITVQ